MITVKLGNVYSDTKNKRLKRNLAEPVLTLNCFSFCGNYYKQTNGVAMGTKMGPSYEIFSQVLSNTNFLVNIAALNLNGRQRRQRRCSRQLNCSNFFLWSEIGSIITVCALYHRGAHSIYNRRQFLSPGSETCLRNFRHFFGFSRQQNFN